MHPIQISNKSSKSMFIAIVRVYYYTTINHSREITDTPLQRSNKGETEFILIKPSVLQV